MGYILWCFLFMITGFVLESCVCIYHRARENDRVVLSSAFSFLITCIGLLVISKIIYSIVNSPMGILSLIYVVMYALGKGIGTYTSLKLWDKQYPKKKHLCCKKPKDGP